MSFELSEDAAITILETADIGGTDTGSTGNWQTWLDMRNFDRVTAIVELGAWNAGDDLDECRLQQATSSAGAGAKDLTTDGAGDDYDTGSPIDADGDQVILSARADQLDAQNDFRYVRVFAGEAGDTGTDNISGVIIRHGARKKFSNQHATAVAASIVYVRPS